MYQLKKEDRKVLRSIGKFYGCKVCFSKDKNLGGEWEKDTITISIDGDSFPKIASIFFHELAHYINSLEKRYPLYHDPKDLPMHKKFDSYRRFVRYALKAEVYTEKLGRKLQKQWFPKMKFHYFYKNNDNCYNFLFGYYMSDSKNFKK